MRYQTAPCPARNAKARILFGRERPVENRALSGPETVCENPRPRAGREHR
jgi:hypothetical protein